MIAAGAVLAGAGAIVVLTAIGGSGHERSRPALQILRGPHARVEARLQPIAKTIAARVERIRGLEFKNRPRVVVMGEYHLASVGRRIARSEHRRARLHPSRLRADRRLERASVELDQLAGLLPPGAALGPDTQSSGLDRIGGAFDFPRNRIIIVPTAIQTRIQLDYTLAHELTHALESQHFNLHLGTFTRPGEASAVHRAVIEGTATLVQDRYQHRYLGDELPIAERIDSARSLIATNPGAYATNAEAIFDYVDGALFVHSLYQRAGDWRLVDRALRTPPSQSQEILHPNRWPSASRAEPIRLGLASILRDHWRRVGGGPAGEEQALVILLAGALGSEAEMGASGWVGGRFAVWAPRSPQHGCAPNCVADNVGVVAFGWHSPEDVSQFNLAAPTYATLGLFAQALTHRTWKLSDGYLALGTAARASALAFAPGPHLADFLSRRSARNASAYDVRRGRADGPRHG
jgi:hypothetical protein